MKKFLAKVIRVLGILMLLLIIAIIAGVIYASSYFAKQTDIPSNSVLKLQFNQNISEKSQEASLIDTYLAGEASQVSMRELLDLLNYASDDPKIKAILIDGNSTISHTKALEVQDAIRRFKLESNKPVYAFGDFYNQGAYLNASIADSIFISPSGNIDLKGYSAIFPYYKEFLERYNIEMEVFRAGKYKSYVESYLRNDISEENHEQYSVFLSSLLDELNTTIYTNKGIDKQSIHSIINENKAYNSKNCLELHLVDGIKYKTDFHEQLLSQYPEEKRGIITLAKYKNYYSRKIKNKKANVAYVVINGGITVDGKETSSNQLQIAFKEIRENDDIKTIVLRIDSGGGSAFASEEIWYEIELCKKAGKKIISSISSIAGSGGYYVAANSDKIFANTNSIVGSIGVFTAFPVFQDALRNQLGVHFDTISTGPFSTRLSGYVALTEQQRNHYEASTNELYNKFLDRVSVGRDLPKDFVDEIAQGRIYSGEEGVQMQLVDSLINLYEVLEYVKRDQGLNELVLEEYPKSQQEYFPNYGIMDLFKSKVQFGKEISQVVENSFEEFNTLLTSYEPQARTPFFQISE